MNSPSSRAEDWDDISPLPLRQKLTKESAAGVRAVPTALICLEDYNDDDVESCSTRIDDGVILEMKGPLSSSQSHHPIRHRRTNAEDKESTGGGGQHQNGSKAASHTNGQRRRNLWEEFRDESVPIANAVAGRVRLLLQPFQRLYATRRRLRCWSSSRLKRVVAVLIIVVLLGIMAWAGYVFTKRRLVMRSVTPFDQVKQQSPAWTIPASKAQWAVFYNVYISPSPILSGLGRLLVEEQLGQVASSYAASANDLVVYTTTIGQPLHAQWLDRVCATAGPYNLTCQQTAHYESADELVTLTRLHQYCKENPTHSAIYLHNKGSLHPGNKGQDRWRRAMTAATTSQLCLDPVAAAVTAAENLDQVTTCGLVFQTLPSNHYPGNMWSAKCSYVNKLLSPNDFQTRHRVVDEWLNTQLQMGVFTPKGGLFPMERHYTGRERYAAEQWLGSHPDILPCDVSKEANKDYWLDEDRDFEEFEVAVAPRHDINANWIWRTYMSNNATLTDPFLRKRDFFLLRGMIYRWLVWYGHLPDWHSWVWTWFPDGELWREETSKRGAWVAVNAVADLPGTTEVQHFSTSEEAGVSNMYMNTGKFEY